MKMSVADRRDDGCTYCCKFEEIDRIESMKAKNLKLPLQTFRLKNFKAVRDSGVIRFTPLTVFIGNNGVGKSSIVEGV